MPPRMSFAKTVFQMERTEKDVTRRTGWWDVEKDEPRLHPGDLVIAIEKGMGLPKGSSQVVICPIEVVSTRREPLGDITEEDVEREGFPGMSREGFIKMFGCEADDIITRIEFTYSLCARNRVEYAIGRKNMDALFRDALSGFVTKRPPRWARAWAERLGDGSGADRLQDWTVTHLRHHWMTGIGAIESAEHMLEVSVGNGNLRDDYPWDEDEAVLA